eukprot:scaffold6298_cov151-Isochrysis_galbana.AAC.2
MEVGHRPLQPLSLVTRLLDTQGRSQEEGPSSVIPFNCYYYTLPLHTTDALHRAQPISAVLILHLKPGLAIEKLPYRRSDEHWGADSD